MAPECPHCVTVQHWNKRSSAKATAGAMSPYDLQDLHLVAGVFCIWLLGKLPLIFFWNLTGNYFQIPFIWAIDHASITKRTWDLAICIWLLGSFASGCWGVLHLIAREVAIDILLKLNCKLLSNTFHMSHILCLYHEKNLRFGHLHLVAKELCIWLLGRLPWRFHFSKFEMWIQRPFQWALDQVCTFSSCWDRPPIALHRGRADVMGWDVTGTSSPKCHVYKKIFGTPLSALP